MKFHGYGAFLMLTRKYDAYHTQLNVAESDLDNLKEPGDYTVYFSSVNNSSNFIAGALIYLRVRRVMFNTTNMGYIQEAICVYGGTYNYTRANYLNQWGVWY